MYIHPSPQCTLLRSIINNILKHVSNSRLSPGRDWLTPKARDTFLDWGKQSQALASFLVENSKLLQTTATSSSPAPAAVLYFFCDNKAKSRTQTLSAVHIPAPTLDSRRYDDGKNYSIHEDSMERGGFRHLVSLDVARDPLKAGSRRLYCRGCP